MNTFNILSFKGKYKILHMTWFAFFMAFVLWLGIGPLMPFIQEALQLTNQEAKVLLLLNIGITIPARIVVGILVDKYGPRIMFSMVLIFGGLISILFSWMQSYESIALTRFLSGFIGAGFVVGIRIISEWFPAKQIGIAQGIYGGWGNFGSAGAAISLPLIAGLFIEDGWRYALTIISLLTIIYGVIYYFNVSNTPKNATYFKPKKTGAIEVSNKKDLALYILMNLPLYLAMAAIVWKLSPNNMGVITALNALLLYILLAAIYAYQVYKIVLINYDILVSNQPQQNPYKFKQVAILNIAYLVSFGTELAIVSILAMFYIEWFELSKINAALIAGIYPFLNLVARPGGGYLSDILGRKITLIIAFSGLSFLFLILAAVNTNWEIYSVIMLTLMAGIFSEAGSGAVFAMVPLIQKRMTGQFAGMVGAFGNVGGVLFLTLNSFVSYDMMFLIIGCCSAFTLFIVMVFLDEENTEEAMDSRLIAQRVI